MLPSHYAWLGCDGYALQTSQTGAHICFRLCLKWLWSGPHPRMRCSLGGGVADILPTNLPTQGVTQW